MKKPNFKKLTDFGFTEDCGTFKYTAEIMDGQMKMTVFISGDGSVRADVVDTFSGEEYVLHRVQGATGSFVGRVKAEYEAVLGEIYEKCFENDIFKSDAAKAVIAYAREKCGDEPEYLWQKFPDNAVIRRSDTKKWYAALLTVSRSKLGLKGDDKTEIIDLRIKPDELEELIDHKHYFPGYHMNKKHWYTICLDGSVSTDEICKRLDESHKLAIK